MVSSLGEAGVPALDVLLSRLVREGLIRDEETARTRIVLGYPVWLVLGELQPWRILFEVGRAWHLPVVFSSQPGFTIDLPACAAYGPERLSERRWLPLSDGQVAIADPFKAMPDGALARSKVILAPHEMIDSALAEAFPALPANARQRRRLGRYLIDSGAVSEQVLAEALLEQNRNGGRLGEILIANDLVERRRSRCCWQNVPAFLAWSRVQRPSRCCRGRLLMSSAPSLSRLRTTATMGCESSARRR